MTAMPADRVPAERGQHGPWPVRGYACGKEDYLRRLRKIEGQVRGLQKMIEADSWCPDVVTQVASVTRALQEVAVGLLNDHLRHCVTAAAATSPGDGDAGLAEVTAVLRQVIRL
jgi:DNA-binding FrmR family transcriptional regulator